MARLLTIQRRLLLFVTAVIFTFIIRIISMSVGSSLREGRSSVIVSDRGHFKQVALRISKLNAKGILSQPFKLGFDDGEGSISYLLRIANFFPFVMVENLGLYEPGNPTARVPGIGMLVQSSCDGGGDGGGDDGGDGDGSDGGYC